MLATCGLIMLDAGLPNDSRSPTTIVSPSPDTRDDVCPHENVLSIVTRIFGSGLLRSGDSAIDHGDMMGIVILLSFRLRPWMGIAAASTSASVEKELRMLGVLLRSASGSVRSVQLAEARS